MNYLIEMREARSFRFDGLGVKVKYAGERSRESIAIVEYTVDPGKLAHAHVHSKEDEYCYVLEGEIGFRVGDQIFHSGPGAYILKPRGVPHTFWNRNKEKPARLIEIISPAGFEVFFSDCHETNNPVTRAMIAAKNTVSHTSLMKRGARNFVTATTSNR